MRRLILIASLLASGAVSAQGWDADDSARRTRNAGSGTAPTGFLAPSDVDETEWDEDDAPAKKVEEDEGDRRTKKRSGELPARERASGGESRGIVVIEENTAAPSVIRAGEVDQDRVGRSLGGTPTRGMSLGASRADEGVSTFSAAADDSPPRERGRTPPPPRERTRSQEKKPSDARSPAPSSILVPVNDDDFEETPSARSDPFDVPVGRPRDDTPTARSLLDSLPTGESGASAPARSAPAPRDGALDVDYDRETTIRVDAKPAKKPKEPPRKAEVVVAPPPPPRKVEPAPAPTLELDEEPRSVAVSPQPERPLKAETKPEPKPEPKPAKPVKAAAKPALAYDPFAKLEGDLAEAEGRTRPAPTPPPEPTLPDPPDEPTYKRPPELARETFADPEMASKPLADPKEKVEKRDDALLGVSVVAGLGLLVANAPASGYAVHFGGGANARWHPAFLGGLSLDGSFWRASQADGTPVVTVDTAWTHIALRLLYVKETGDGPFIGGGAGLLLTHVSSAYVVNDLVSETKTGGLARPGLDVTAMFGWRYRPVEVRLDLRGLLRGGLRLDYLPTLSFGVSL